MTKLVTDKCPCCGTRGLNPKKIKDMCENCLETSFDQWRRKVVSLEKETAELKKDKEYLDKVNNEQTEVILHLNEQIEKMKSFIYSEIDFCMYCPLTNECKNDEGTCPYANTTEEEQKNLLSDWITK